MRSSCPCEECWKLDLQGAIDSGAMARNQLCAEIFERCRAAYIVSSGANGLKGRTEGRTNQLPMLGHTTREGARDGGRTHRGESGECRALL